MAKLRYRLCWVFILLLWVTAKRIKLENTGHGNQSGQCWAFKDKGPGSSFSYTSLCWRSCSGTHSTPQLIGMELWAGKVKLFAVWNCGSGRREFSLKSKKVAWSSVLPVRCLLGVTDLFQFGIDPLGRGNDYFLQGNWKASGDTTALFLFLGPQAPTNHAVTPQISLALQHFIVVLFESLSEVWGCPAGIPWAAC